ncbi:MAG: hypothetical protein PHY73_02060 [Candidatus Omnitrophica bacterium]|nr:hypothetical protein [Candidatus Omnitrophota bacterium]
MKKVIIILVLLFLPTLAFAQSAFFPPEESQQNGYDVTVQNWNQLKLHEKSQFISESLEEIERNTGEHFSIPDMGKFQSATDIAIDYFVRNAPNAKVPMIKFILDLLRLEGSTHDSLEVFPNVG